MFSIFGNPKYENATWEMLDFSPPISSKVTKVRSALRTVDWNAKEIQEKGFSLDNPGYMAGGQIISATTNVPLDRLIRKTNNIADAVGEDTEVWQKLALLSGWSLWELEQGAKTSTDRKKKKYKSSRKRPQKRKSYFWPHGKRQIVKIQKRAENIEPELLKECLEIGKKLLQDLFKDHEKLIQCRIDFACCMDNDKRCREFFINEIEICPTIGSEYYEMYGKAYTLLANNFIKEILS